MATCAGPSLEDVLSRHGLEKAMLESQCPRKVRLEIAKQLLDWKMVGHNFEFPSWKIREIERDNDTEELRKVALLEAWKEREGAEATYLKLAGVLHRRNRNDLVDFLCEKINSVVGVSPNASNSIGDATCMPPCLSADERQLAEAIVPKFEESGDEVRKGIKNLEREFDELHGRLIYELTSGDRAVSIDNLLQSLTKLPLVIRRSYESTIQEMLPNLETKKTINALFLRLNRLFTFIDFELLEHLIKKFGSALLRKDMKVYVHRIRRFKKETKVGDLIDYWPGQRIPDYETTYQELRIKFEGDPKVYSLEKLDTFRRRYCNALRLSDFISVFILEFVEAASSFYAVWIIPTVIFPDVIAAAKCVGSSFYVKDGIVMVSLHGKSLFDRQSTLLHSQLQSQRPPRTLPSLIRSSPRRYLVMNTLPRHSRNYALFPPLCPNPRLRSQSYVEQEKDEDLTKL